MATIALIIGGAIANALAFTGGNYLFKQLDKSGDDERIRHDKAMEELQRVTLEWNENRVKTLDYLNRQMQLEKQTSSDFDDVDNALKLYNEVTNSTLQIAPKPELREFYQPSEKQKYYEYLFITGSIVGIGFLAYHYNL